MTCFMDREFEFGDFWIEGEPLDDGFFLIRAGLSPKGDVFWVFLSQVTIDTKGSWGPRGAAYYQDNVGADRGWNRFGSSNRVMAHCDPTGENFELALEELKESRLRLTAKAAQGYWDLWQCKNCGTQKRYLGMRHDEKQSCPVCYERGSFVLVNPHYREEVIDCPGCGAPFCVEHQRHLNDCPDTCPPTSTE